MKRILFLLSMIGVFALIPACEPEADDPNQSDQPVEINHQLSVSPEHITISPEGGYQTISITSTKDWTVSASDSWVSVSPSSGKASVMPVTVTVGGDTNTTYEDRSATLTVKMGDMTQTITVQQSANLDLILTTKACDLTSDAQSFDITVQANVEYAVSVSDEWIKQTGTKALASKTLTFSVEDNDFYDGRSATITLRPQDGSVAEQVDSFVHEVRNAVGIGIRMGAEEEGAVIDKCADHVFHILLDVSKIHVFLN